MKRTLFALLVSLAAFAQEIPPPVVDAVVPNNGPDTGHTVVDIRGSRLDRTVQCLLPCPTRVGFGETFVDAIEVSPTQLTVSTPAHPAGTVDVTIAIPGRPNLVMADAFTFQPTAESAYERVLLPIYFGGTLPGAYGAQWQTELWIHNSGPDPVAIANRVCPVDMVCPPVFPLTYSLAPGKSLHNPEDFFAGLRNNPSLVLYVGDEGAKSTSFGLRVADTSRHALHGGTDLPVIRENELLTDKSQFLNVPMDNGMFRLLLRVYDVVYDRAEFAVRFYDANGETGLPAYGTTVTATTPFSAPFRGEAAYAELDISQLLNLRLLWPQVARIEIQPMTPGSRYWAVVSLTNNETQLVTLVTPQ